MWIVIILGIIAFLAMEHPVALGFVFVPLAALFIITMIAWLKNNKAGLSGLIWALFILAIIVAALLFVCST